MIKLKGEEIMKFLIQKTPDNFIKSVNDEISSILNRHFDDMYPQYGFNHDVDALSMPVELIEKEKEYVILAELPGVEKENLDIDIDKNYLTIKAKKEEKMCTEKDAYKKTEFKYGEFSRTVYLPLDVDIENTDAVASDIVSGKKAYTKKRKKSLTPYAEEV